MISKIRTLLQIPFYRIARIFSYLFPRDKNIWVFIGWHKNKEGEIFADNSKYLFLYASQQKEVKAIWIGKDKKISRELQKNGFSSYYLKTFAGIYYSLIAKYTIIDGLMQPENWMLAGNSKIIQLWHGKGMKKTGYDTPYSLPKYNRFLFPHLFVPFYKTVASSNTTATMMASAFHLSPETIIVAGLPRDDVLFKKIKGSEMGTNPVLEKKENKYAKEIIYAPTFRPDGSNPVDNMNLARLNELLCKKNFNLFIQLHPKFAFNNVRTITYSNISYLNPGYDIYPSLKKFDAMITDYSSIYTDFLLLDRPIIFFIYDLDKYKQIAGLYENFEDLSPGSHCKNWQELLEAINNIDKDEHKEYRLSVTKKLFAYMDGNASERIFRSIK